MLTNAITYFITDNIFKLLKAKHNICRHLLCPYLVVCGYCHYICSCMLLYSEREQWKKTTEREIREKFELELRLKQDQDGVTHE